MSLCKRTVLAITFFLITTSLMAGAAIADSVGIVTKAVGDVRVEQESGQTIQVSTGRKLYRGDTILTGEDSLVHFELGHAGIIHLDENTVASIDELYSEEETSIIRLAAGYLWAKIRKMAGGTSDFEVHTPTAIAGVRGTEFEVVAGLDGATAVAVDDGAVEVLPEESEKGVLVEKGSMIELEPGKALKKPFKAKEKKQRQWAKWRKAKKKQLLENLPKKLDKAEKKMDRLEANAKKAQDKLFKGLEKLEQRIDKMTDKKKPLGPLMKKQAKKKAKKVQAQLKKSAKAYRRMVSQAKASQRLTQVIQDRLATMKGLDEQFSPQELGQIQERLGALNQRSKDFVQDAQNLKEDIRQRLKATFQKLPLQNLQQDNPAKGQGKKAKQRQ